MKLKNTLLAVATLACAATAVGVVELKGSKSEFCPDTLEFRRTYFIYDEAFCYGHTAVPSELMDLIRQYAHEAERPEAGKQRWDLARGEKFRTRGWNGPAKDIANRANDPTLVNWSAENPGAARALWPRVAKLLGEQEYTIVKLLFEDIGLVREDNVDTLVQAYREMIAQ